MGETFCFIILAPLNSPKYLSLSLSYLGWCVHLEIAGRKHARLERDEHLIDVLVLISQPLTSLLVEPLYRVLRLSLKPAQPVSVLGGGG